MRDTSEPHSPETCSSRDYHERIKLDIAAFMLKRMVGDVTSEKERAEFMNACVAASATLAAGQSVFLAGQETDRNKRAAIIQDGKDIAIRMMKAAYDEYITEALQDTSKSSK